MGLLLDGNGNHSTREKDLEKSGRTLRVNHGDSVMSHSGGSESRRNQLGVTKDQGSLKEPSKAA
ncbi:MAG: hypothetical protein MK106_07145 [Mariniblastus sp.]|nr:hypothetical protein [Mariniblastus sp.]